MQVIETLQGVGRSGGLGRRAERVGELAPPVHPLFGGR
jgi:hypothetical protein